MMVQKVGLYGVKFNAAVGYFEEERIFKNDFLVDIWASFVNNDVLINEDLKQTLDYGLLYSICAEAFKLEALLIETVAQSILNQIKKDFPWLIEINIKIKKLNPPLQAEIDFSFVELNYKK